MDSSQGEVLEARKTYEDFIYGEARETTMLNVTNVISAHFEKIRDVLKLGDVAPVTVARVHGFEEGQQERLESSIGTPMVSGPPRDPSHDFADRAKKYNPVPSHIVPKSKRIESPAPRRASPSKSHYHFHGDRYMSPKQIRKELYLHRDVFLSTSDADLEQAVLHHVHRHPPNHPEQECKVLVARIRHKDVHVPGHIVAHQCPGTVHPAPRPVSPSKRISPLQAQKDAHLRHDMFLTSRDDDLAALALRRALPHAANRPETEHLYRALRSPQQAGSPSSQGRAQEVPGQGMPGQGMPGQGMPGQGVRPRPTTASALRARRGSGVAVAVAAAQAPKRSASASASALRRNSSSVSASSVKEAVSSPAHPVTAPSPGPGPAVASTATSDSAAPVSAAPKGKGLTVTSGGSMVNMNLASMGSLRNLVSPTTVADRLSPVSAEQGPGQGQGPGALSGPGRSPLKKRFNFSARAAEPSADAAITIATPLVTRAGGTVASTRSMVPATPCATSVDTTNRAALNTTPDGSVIGKRASPPTGQYCPRPLTAAEHAAAVALTCKLSAANRAYCRPEGPPVQPRPAMSRALSRLIYNVRPGPEE